MLFRIRFITNLFNSLILSLILFSVDVYAQGNNIIIVSGHIVDNDSKQSLEGVSVQVKGTVGGTVTNAQGEFSLKTKAKYPFSLVFSSVGFQTREFTVTGPDRKSVV